MSKQEICKTDLSDTLDKLFTLLAQEHREAKEQRDREGRESKKSDVKEVLKESKKHKEPKEHKETTSLEKQSKKPPYLPSTSQEMSAGAAASSSPPHLPHATVGASTSNVPTSLYGTSGPSMPTTPLDTFVSGPLHGKQLSPIQSASTLRNSPPLEPPGAVLSKGSIGPMTMSPGTSTKGSGSHTISISKTNIGLGVVGPRHESPPGPPPFR